MKFFFDEACYYVSLKNSWLPRFLVSHILRWNNARSCSILSAEREPEGRNGCIALEDRENFSDGVVEGRPFETKDLLFSTYQLDSTSRLHEYQILTYGRLRDRGSSRS